MSKYKENHSLNKLSEKDPPRELRYSMQMDRILNIVKYDPSQTNKKIEVIFQHREYLENTSDIAYGSFKKDPKGICYCDGVFQKISDGEKTEIQRVSGYRLLVEWKYYGPSWECLEDLQFLFHDQPAAMMKQYNVTITPSPKASSSARLKF